MYLITPFPYGSWRSSLSNYGNNSTLMSRCIKLLKTLCIDDDWLKQNQNSSLGKLLFKNGYLDLRKNEFHDEFNPNIVFFARINMNYEEQSHSQLCYSKDIFQRLFINPLGIE